MNIPLHLLSIPALCAGAAAGTFLTSMAKLHGPKPLRIPMESLRHGFWMAAYSSSVCLLLVGLNASIVGSFFLGVLLLSALWRFAYKSKNQVLQLGLIAWIAAALGLGAFIWSTHPDACSSGSHKERALCAVASAQASLKAFAGSWFTSSAVPKSFEQR